MQMKADLTRCAEAILLACQHYFPTTIADMYDPVRRATPLEYRMDQEFPLVREAHERNDETIDRIYIFTTHDYPLPRNPASLRSTPQHRTARNAK